MSFLSSNLDGQTYPSGFSQVQVASGISSPTVMAFAPDGRLFVAQQTGQLRIIQNGTLLTTPFISLSVNSSGERGLLGIAFDPNFNSNQYIYLYYTVSSGANNRVSRFTANGNVAVSGSEVVILNLDPLSTATNHNGGTIQFGTDGKLYIGVGENANSANAQNLDTYLGKILRINPDGSVPAGNPFTSGTAQKQRIWAYGMRNPYTLAIQPGTGRLFINDVGQNTWEEVNDCPSGGLNYGWPLAEGISTNAAYTNPIYTYSHGTGIGSGCAITGGTFFNPASSNYPSQYIGRYFFLDYCNNWIDMLTLSGGTATRANFASSIAGSPVAMATGPDGNLYFLSRTTSAVYKITYTGSTGPVITNQPQSLSVAQGNPASFSVTSTGTQPFSYQWRKNLVNIPGANNSTYTIPSVVINDGANYSVIVSNTVGSATSNNALLTVTAPNQSPTATITSPLSGTTYIAGSTITYSGTGNDPENGILPASSFSWFVNFHHDTHIHPGPALTSGTSNGSFVVPNTGETSANVFYRLYLVVTDLQGAKDTDYIDIKPKTSTITLNTSPQGLQVTLDGQPFTAPIVVTSVAGMLRTLGAPSPQGSYTFNNWSQGGSATQTITTQQTNTTYTATYTVTPAVTTLTPIADAYVNSGKASTNYGASTSLYLQKSSSSSRNNEVYLKFDISSISNTSSSVKLRLYGGINTTLTPSCPVEVHQVTNTTWLENTINWSNRPSAQSTILGTTTIAGTTLKYYEWNLTSHILSLKNAGINTLSIKLNNSIATSSQIVINSKESTANRPQLVVTTPAPAPFTLPVIQTTERAKTELNIVLYPNPVKDELIIHNYSSSGELKLFDLGGRLIKVQAINGFATDHMEVRGLMQGMYLVYFQNEAGTITKKIIIE